MKLITATVLIALASMQVTAQHFILDERSTAKYFNYLSQVKAVEKSLLSNVLNPDLELSEKFKITSKLLNTLSSKFNGGLPKDFHKTDIVVLDTDIKEADTQFIRWTYATIAGRDITAHIQLIVYFDVDLAGEGIKYPKVKNIEVMSKQQMFPIEKEGIIEKYQKSKASFSPPPRIDD